MPEPFIPTEVTYDGTLGHVRIHAMAKRRLRQEYYEYLEYCCDQGLEPEPPPEPVIPTLGQFYEAVLKKYETISEI